MINVNTTFHNDNLSDEESLCSFGRTIIIPAYVQAALLGGCQVGGPGAIQTS